jgi:hypothetical protein
MSLQYYKPDGDLNVGDCMPFFHDGVFRLFYLLDEGHHKALGGLGGHQWCQAQSRDLVHWEHLPMALPITADWEGSICTGSVLFHEGTYYAYYATRKRDFTQHLGLAVSEDGIHFRKTEPNPFASPPPGYSPYHYRDPFALRDGDGRFHLLVSASLETYPVPERGGCLAHLVSDDLSHWEVLDPLLLPGLHNVPECADHFFWRGWYYLVFSNDGIARYRLSRRPFGPWGKPAQDVLDCPASRVMKTAAFRSDRRIGAAWIGCRRDGLDNGPFLFGGNVLFRELIQEQDGSLGTAFPVEMTLRGKECACVPVPVVGDVQADAQRVSLRNRDGLAAARCSEIPHDARLTMRVSPQPGMGSFGLRLCAEDTFETGYELLLQPPEKAVRLAGQTLLGVDGLESGFSLEVVLQGELADVCIDGRRTLVDRWPQRHGRGLFLFGLNAEVEIHNLRVEDLS